VVRKRKPGTKAVSLSIDPALRAEIMRLTGAKTFTEAIHEALAELVLRERARLPYADAENWTVNGSQRRALDYRVLRFRRMAEGGQDFMNDPSRLPATGLFMEPFVIHRPTSVELRRIHDLTRPYDLAEERMAFRISVLRRRRDGM
jgi:hypothetical protein